MPNLYIYIYFIGINILKTLFHFYTSSNKTNNFERFYFFIYGLSTRRIIVNSGRATSLPSANSFFKDSMWFIRSCSTVSACSFTTPNFNKILSTSRSTTLHASIIVFLGEIASLLVSFTLCTSHIYVDVHLARTHDASKHYTTTSLLYSSIFTCTLRTRSHARACTNLLYT